MDNKSYTTAIENKQYPKDNMVPLDISFVNNTVTIQKLPDITTDIK